ncbi:MAG TPA: 4Fe-4S dicluster domain-containing protein [Candidatus Limnocylindrales bacterium]|nr:4Fe-4S dicluster domain-containing protein [Candidatus Limnocylindrales bacterium]
MSLSRPVTLQEKTRKFLRLTQVRVFSQVVFFGLFLFSVWATWTSRLEGYPVSRLLEMDPLVAVSTALSTGYIYRYLGWALGIIVLTFLFGRVFCNWICPFGTLHQFVNYLFNIQPNSKRIEQNRYHPAQYFKYAILVVFLIMAALGALQIGLLDPIVMMYRGFATFVSSAWNMLISAITPLFARVRIEASWSDTLKFSPGVAHRVFVGSFWIGLWFLLFVALNLWKPRFFCRFVCPLGAFLGVLARYSLFRINRDVTKCTDCNLCLTRCEGAADPQSMVRKSECFSCMNCIDDCPEDALQFTMMGLDRKQVVEAPDISRRRLVFAGITGLLAFPLLRNNGTATDENFSPHMIRPPGSVAEPEFLKKCIKCDQCINMCPTNVLQPATLKEGGFETLWTPVMNFNIGHCQLNCTLCSEVCPTGAIRKITVAEKLGKGEYTQKGPIVLGTAFINTTRCLPWANQIPCVVCEEVCPVSPKAIQTIDEEVKDVFGKRVILNKPFIVPDLCIGCGICQHECPVQDDPAVYVTAIGESRSKSRRLLLHFRSSTSN